MAAELSREDLEKALEFVHRVQAAGDLNAYRNAVLDIDELVPAKIVAYNEIDLETGKALALVKPEVLGPGDMETFERYNSQNPLLAYYASHDDRSPKALSDVADAETLHATDLYREFYSRHGIEDQIVLMLPAPQGELAAVVINRGERGFSDRERTLLSLVQPHAVQAFRMAREAERSRRRIDELSARLRRIADPVAEASQAYRLTERQTEVLRLLVSGRTSAEIAERLGLSPTTVVKHLDNVRIKVGVESKVQLVAEVLGHPRSDRERG